MNFWLYKDERDLNLYQLMVIKYPIVFIRVKAHIKWKKSYVPKERVNQKSIQTEIRTLSKQGKKKISFYFAWVTSRIFYQSLSAKIRWSTYIQN